MIRNLLHKFTTRLGHTWTIPDIRKAYGMTFRRDFGSDVLSDLAEFCRASEMAPGTGEMWLQGRTAGRRDVWLHIQEMLHLTEEELYDLYVGRSVETQAVAEQRNQ
jgi:hypothetical protein